MFCKKVVENHSQNHVSIVNLASIIFISQSDGLLFKQGKEAASSGICFLVALYCLGDKYTCFPGQIPEFEFVPHVFCRIRMRIVLIDFALTNIHFHFLDAFVCYSVQPSCFISVLIFKTSH